MKIRVLSSENLKKYIYNGPVRKFNTYVGDMKLETMAESRRKAVSNMKYQIRKRLGLLNSVPIKIDETRVHES